MKTKKNVVAGLGEIGLPILKILSRKIQVVGYDINTKLMDKRKLKKFSNLETSILHICIPFSKNFLLQVISLSKKFNPEIIVIHSTVSPYTTQKLQSNLSIPILYSATRGVHKRMISDMKKYTKFYALEKNAPKKKWASDNYSSLLKKCGIKSKKMSEPITLELAKIVVDTSYYGWLINYAQLSNMIAKEHKVDYDEMWSFTNEIHEFLGNRPKMFPGFIGGHCVLPNLDLIHNQTLNLIKEINKRYLKEIPHAKSISKKYEKILSKRRKKGKKY